MRSELESAENFESILKTKKSETTDTALMETRGEEFLIPALTFVLLLGLLPVERTFSILVQTDYPGVDDLNGQLPLLVQLAPTVLLNIVRSPLVLIMKILHVIVLVVESLLVLCQNSRKMPLVDLIRRAEQNQQPKNRQNNSTKSKGKNSWTFKAGHIQ